MVESKLVPLRILVADDEPMVMQMIGAALRFFGNHVDLASGGSEALRSWHEAEYDLLILDAMMERQSGVEIASRIRDDGSDIPIVLMSSGPAGTDRLGPLAYTLRVEILRKPFGAKDLQQSVDRALRRFDL
jgi:CheY-like chemotaxis protein